MTTPFARHIDALMDELGKAASRASEDAGLSQSFIRDLKETGNPTWIKLRQFAHHHGLSVYAVMGESPGPDVIEYDPVTLRRAMTVLSEIVRVDRLNIPSDKLGELAVVLYGLMYREKDNPQKIAADVARFRGLAQPFAK
jgi:hypothetical protein